MINMNKSILKEHIRYSKEKVRDMCVKLDELNGRTPKEILNITKQNNTIPIDLDHILENLGLFKIPTTFEDLERSGKFDNMGEISGLVLLNGNDIGIFYKETDSIHRKRFTIAHELAHCCLHGDILKSGYVEFRNSINSTDEREIAANTFAGELLIPKKQLLRVYKKLIVPSLKGLADIFEVSANVMRERLKCLELPFYDDVINNYED